MAIRQLPDDLVNRIAAGEVVERPASVVKELIENALDAGGRRIRITTAGGGRKLVRIEDDGCGMPREDLQLSIERHATSKLSDDALDDIKSLGFRGEALASIGAVSELSLSSRTADGEAGHKIGVSYGRVGEVLPHGMNRGTTVEMRDLFARLPARLKFLKSDRAEAGAITDVVKRLALANPDVHFVLEGSDRTTSNWPAQTGASALRARVAQILGAEFTENAVTLSAERDGVTVAGIAGLPTYTRANSLQQFYFVNGRSVRDKILLSAVRGAYADFIFRDRFPVIALFVAVDPQSVDVNVHPAKAELRFRDGGGVRSAVYRGIQTALADAGYKAASNLADIAAAAFQQPAPPGEPHAYSPQATVTQPFDAGPRAAPSPARYAADRAGFAATASGVATLAGLAEPSARYTQPDTLPAKIEEHPLGVARAQMFDNYIIAQNADGLLMVDQHAAHERLVYERFKAALRAGPVESQAQLIPVVVELAEDDCDRLEAAAPQLQRLGLYLERFGVSAVAVQETPALLGRADISALVHDVADGLADWGTTELLSAKLDAVIGRMACHGSVRSGRQLRPEEMNALLREMEKTPHSGQCIHGRPTYVELKKSDIEKLFGRTR